MTTPKNHPPQTRENHARFHPPFHFVLAPLLVAFLVLSAIQLFRSVELHTVSLVLLAVILFLLAMLVRTYPLKVQDRLICLEQQLRCATLLPESVRTAAGSLAPAPWVALRFAGDEEFSELVQLTLKENLTPAQIKDRIVNWKPDYFRV